jgi:hypothetical protein
MNKVKTIFLVVFLFLFAGSACNLPAGSAVQPAGPDALLVSVNAPAEYRSGPGGEFETAGVLEPGRQVEAIGRSPDGGYLLLRDPATASVLGWLESASATTSGNPFSLPTYAPLPAASLAATAPVSGCPSPVGGGPTPVSCSGPVTPVVSGCPSPVGGGPTPVSCSGPGAPPVSGCPSPVGGGPTPVSCSGPGAPVVSGCPSPVGGGPTPVSCSGPAAPPPSGGGKPTPVAGSTLVPAPTSVPTLVK